MSGSLSLADGGFGEQVSGPSIGCLAPAPVWHASVAQAPDSRLSVAALRNVALTMLESVGDANAGEWHHWSGRAFHVRRRLSAAEIELTGPAVDVRGTPEARARAEAARRARPELPERFFLEEIGGSL
jgi:hypothetical protein